MNLLIRLLTDNIRSQIERDTYVLENNRKQIQPKCMLETLLDPGRMKKRSNENKELFVPNEISTLG